MCSEHIDLTRRNLDYFRGADILFSLAVAHSRHHKLTTFPASFFMKYLVSARRNLGLYQHHDGITGTGKDFVNVDYGSRMWQSIGEMKQVIHDAAEFLLCPNKANFKHSESVEFFDVVSQI